MDITVAELQTHKQALEASLEHAKAQVYRCVGAVEAVTQLLAQAQRPEDTDTSGDTP